MNPDFGITPELVALDEKEEGEVLHPYLCPAGKPTIGFGHRIESMNYPAITHEQAVALLMEDLHQKRDAVLRISPGLAQEPERRCAAIIDFCFNLGEGAYAMSTLRKMVDQKRWPEAAAQMKLWHYAFSPKLNKKVSLPGLEERRNITAGWLL